MKLSQVFRDVSRRGRWARGATVSVGALPNTLDVTRIGVRTRRGLKGATVRNRLKRQVRAILFDQAFPLRGSVDVVVVLHPEHPKPTTSQLTEDLLAQCYQAKVTP